MKTKTSAALGFFLFLKNNLPARLLLTLLLAEGSFLIGAAQSTDTVCTPTIVEIDHSSLLSVFPNPTDGTFQIIYASTTSCPTPGWGGELLINIINKNGKTVFTETIVEFEGEYNRIIDLTGHERGIYIIEIVAGRQKLVKREVLN